MINRAAKNAVDRLAREQWHAHLELGAVDLVVLIGYLQLALTHPTLTPLQQADLRDLIARLAKPLRDREPALGELVDAGDRSGAIRHAFDLPRQ
jgi:hypothetical protein